MNKNEIKNHYFTSRAFTAGTDSFLMSSVMRSVMPSLSVSDSEKLANAFAERLKTYMDEAKDYAERVGN